MKPLVFLDIDGVLNGPYEYHIWSKAKREIGEDAASAIYEAKLTGNLDEHLVELLFRESCVDILNQITDVTDSDIVVSSSWRFFYADKPEQLVALLRRVGVTAPILGLTPPQVGHRGYAIEEWLKENVPGGETAQIVILDDEGEYSFPTLEKFLMQTNGTVGLQHGDFEKAVKIQQGTPWRRK